MNTLTTAELQSRLDAGPVALFDVRGDLLFEEGHIPGAMSAPLGSLVYRVASIMKAASFVAVYSDGDNGLATEAARRLGDLRMENVHVYEAGINGWAKAGLPVVASAEAKVIGRGEVTDVRPLIVDRERAYGGAFRGEPVDVDGAGG